MNDAAAVWVADSHGRVDLVSVLRRVLASPAGPEMQKVLLAIEDSGVELDEQARGLLRQGWARQAAWAAARATGDPLTVLAVEAPSDPRLRGEAGPAPGVRLLDELEQAAPGPETMSRLLGIDPRTVPDLGLASLVCAWRRAAGWVFVAQAVAVAEAAARCGNFKGWQGAELAEPLGVGARAASRLIDQSSALVHGLPGIRNALTTGRLGVEQAKAVIEELVLLLDEHLLAEAERQVLALDVETLSPARLKELSRAIVLALDPAAGAERRRRARRSAGIRLRTEPDGMAALDVYGPVEQISQIHQGIDHHADTLSPVDPVTGEELSIGQQRLNALHELITAGWNATEPTHGGGQLVPLGQTSETALWPAAYRRPARRPVPDLVPTRSGPPGSGPPGAGPAGGSRRARRRWRRPVQVQVVIDLPTLLGLADNPGAVVGYGPIDPDLARILATDADWVRWVTDPVTGHLLDEGRRRLPSPRLRGYIQARDGTCRIPGCGMPGVYTDVDHAHPYSQGGTTSAASLGLLCITHNRTREHSGWSVRHAGADGSITWTTRLGQTRRVGPHRVLPGAVDVPEPPPPQAPPDWLPAEPEPETLVEDLDPADDVPPL